jgi:hypothetical protein
MALPEAQKAPPALLPSAPRDAPHAARTQAGIRRERIDPSPVRLVDCLADRLGDLDDGRREATMR